MTALFLRITNFPLSQPHPPFFAVYIAGFCVFVLFLFYLCLILSPTHVFAAYTYVHVSGVLKLVSQAHPPSALSIDPSHNM